MLEEIAAEQGRPLAVSEPFMRSLQSLPWKGNARELRSHLEQAVIFSEAGILDRPAPVPDDGTSAMEDTDTLPFTSLHAMVEEAERVHIRKALERGRKSVSRTAELLGISRKTLWEKMKRLGISS